MLSKTSLLALKALGELARLPDAQWEGAASIAQKIRAPRNYLSKVLQDLALEGLLASQRGLKGGFRLSKKARAISLFDAVESIDHVSRWEGCFLDQGACSGRRPCAVHRRWSRVREAYIRFLKRTTVKDLAR